MNKELLFRKRWIEWAIVFVQTDLKSLSDPLRTRLQEEASFFVYPFMNSFNEVVFDQALKGEKGEALTAAVDIKSLQNTLRPVLELILTKTVWRTGCPLHGITTYLNVDRSSDGTERFALSYFADKGWLRSSKRDVNHMISDINGLINLSRLLDGLPTSFMITCKECQKVFIQFSRREKEFCSTTCYQKAYARHRREHLRKDKKAYRDYLAKQAEYMRKRYDQKMKLSYGPHIKLIRRPRTKEE